MAFLRLNDTDLGNLYCQSEHYLTLYFKPASYHRFFDKTTLKLTQYCKSSFSLVGNLQQFRAIWIVPQAFLCVLRVKNEHFQSKLPKEYEMEMKTDDFLFVLIIPKYSICRCTYLFPTRGIYVQPDGEGLKEYKQGCQPS